MIVVGAVGAVSARTLEWRLLKWFVTSYFAASICLADLHELRETELLFRSMEAAVFCWMPLILQFAFWMLYDGV